jgi:hypothetical protein
MQRVFIRELLQNALDACRHAEAGTFAALNRKETPDCVLYGETWELPVIVLALQALAGHGRLGHQRRQPGSLYGVA